MVIFEFLKYIFVEVLANEGLLGKYIPKLSMLSLLVQITSYLYISGTPPRLDKNTIDFSQTEPKAGDNPPEPFSFMNDRVWLEVKNE